MMKIKTVTIVTSGCQIYICRLWNRSPPLSLSLYPSFIERFKANKVTKGETKRKEGGIKRALPPPPQKERGNFSNDNTCIPRFFPSFRQRNQIGWTIFVVVPIKHRKGKPLEGRNSDLKLIRFEIIMLRRRDKRWKLFDIVLLWI